MSIAIFNIRRAISASLAVAASIGALAFSAQAHAGDTYVGGAWAFRTSSDLNCAVGTTCDRADKSSGKIFGGYTFAVTPYNGFNISQSIEGMVYQIGDTKASFATGSGLKAGTGKTTGTGISYKLDFGNDDFGFVTRLGASYARGSTTFATGGSESENAWFAPTVGLGLRYNLTKNVSLTADWDRLPVRYTSSSSEKSNNNMYSLGVAYKF